MSVNERALAELSRRREKRAKRLEIRKNKVYITIPEVADIDRRLRTLVADCAAAAFNKGTGVSALEAISEESLDLQARKRDLLKKHGFEPDYLEDKPFCPLCGDSGFVRGRECKCLSDLRSEIRRGDLSKSLNIQGQSFETFDIELFSGEEDPDYGISPRENMEAILDYCSDYARNLGSHSENLLFTGGTGLGKTFMSSCIAGEAANRGFSVVYDTAVSLFSAFEAEKFGRAGEAVTEPYLKCDLLILDDLGTEMVTNFTLSALYTVINTRLMAGKKTIISTNLDREGLAKKYTAPILSRLEGEYRTLFFFGEDLRLGKRGKYE